MVAAFLANSISLLTAIEKDPSGITGFISGLLGVILNFFFEISYFFMSPGSLGFSIIMLTIVARLLMFPLGIKSQHSMAVTHRLQPEVDKIKKKYGDSKDPEQTRKMNMEIQNLYSKSGSNPIMGCLPMLITLPIFIALFALLRQSYLYVDKLNELYSQIAQVLQGGYNDVVHNLIASKLPKDMVLDPKIVSELAKFVNKCTSADWIDIKNSFSPEAVAQLVPLLDKKAVIETMFSINLIDNSGWGLPGLVIPILTAGATFLSSFVSMRQNKNMEPSQMKMQKYMMFGMPVFMLFITAGASAGVGIYWITSSMFQAGQQWALGKYYNEERLDAYMEKRAEKIKRKKG